MRRLLPALTLLLLYASSIEAQTPPAPGTATTVDASRGGLTVISGPNSLTLGARIQFRWTLDDREDASADSTGSGLGAPDGAISQFDVPRLRVSLTGGAFKPWLRYAFQFDFSRTSGESASKIKDAIIEVRPMARNYRITGGQFKVPFGLQQLTPSGRLQFVDRAITDAKFSPARDMGVMVSGTVARRKAGFNAGVFNCTCSRWDRTRCPKGRTTGAPPGSSIWASADDPARRFAGARHRGSCRTPTTSAHSTSKLRSRSPVCSAPASTSG
ncbi:MAG: hypothetical protein H0W53_09685 [Acidobacteria bacterium]|nr:hypothetical protein [Acidobacteriota bacterium]